MEQSVAMDQGLKNELLELGLEDLIPLPEAVAVPEVLAAIGDTDPVTAISAALAELVAEGRVVLHRGPWDSDPTAVSTDEALALIDDRRWYSFHIDDPNEERIWFVNVENVRG